MDKIDKKLTGSGTDLINQDDNQVSEARRRVLKGAAAVPVLMTVVSRPVLGAQCTPSAWVSGNLSDNGKDRICGGRSPGYWQTNRQDRWAPTGCYPGTPLPSKKNANGTTNAYQADGTKFHSVFSGSQYGNKSLMQVLWLDGTEDRYQLGQHIVAALLNAASIPDYGMSVEDVKEIYRQLELLGYYETSTGETMTPEAVVLFIQNTFSY